MITVIEIDKSGIYDWFRSHRRTLDQAIECWVDDIGETFPKYLVQVAFLDNSDCKVIPADDLEDKWREAQGLE